MTNLSLFWGRVMHSEPSAMVPPKTMTFSTPWPTKVQVGITPKGRTSSLVSEMAVIASERLATVSKLTSRPSSW